MVDVAAQRALSRRTVKLPRIALPKSPLPLSLAPFLDCALREKKIAPRTRTNMLPPALFNSSALAKSLATGCLPKVLLGCFEPCF